MAIRNAKPVSLKPAGASDTSDGSNVFPGAMTALTNLVPDPSTENLWVPRPASIRKYNFSDFSSPGFVSLEFVVGDLVYGMIATSATPGHDEPFIYDLNAGAFVPVTGAVAGNTPNSPATTGPWTPPTAALVGHYVVVTHPGFDGVTNLIGWFDISNPAAPTWDAGNTGTNLLPHQPVAVFNFNGRAYYGLKNTSYFSAELDPLTITNATDFLTHGDTSPVVAYGGTPLTTQLGGIVQSLIVFKSDILFQVTGDLALMNLTNEAISSGVGTSAPLSITSTPEGLSFISTHGMRFVSPTAQISPVVGSYGAGISVPFINSSVPSRICAAFNVDTVRITCQRDDVLGNPTQEWWYNTDQENWSGPHTFPASLIQPWRDTFIMTPYNITASLWESDSEPQETSVYMENGVQMTFKYSSSPVPLTGLMEMNQIVETSIGVAFNTVQGAITATAYDENDIVLDQVPVPIPFGGSIWGTMIWGAFIWGAGYLKYQQVRIPWSKPLVFGQAVFSVTGNAIPGFQIGTLFNRYQPLGYMLQSS